MFFKNLYILQKQKKKRICASHTKQDSLKIKFSSQSWGFMPAKSLPFPCTPHLCPTIPTSTTGGSDCKRHLRSAQQPSIPGSSLGGKLWCTGLWSTIVSDFLLWLSTFSGLVPKETFWAQRWFCPPPTNLHIPIWIFQNILYSSSWHSYGETNFVVTSVTNRLICFKFLFY